MCSRSATRRVRGHRAGSPAAVPDACPRPARAPRVRPRCAPLPTRRCPRAGLNRSSGCTCRDTSSIILSPEQHPRRQRLRAPRQGWAHAHPRDGRLIGTPRRVGAPTARVSPGTVDPSPPVTFEGFATVPEFLVGPGQRPGISVAVRSDSPPFGARCCTGCCTSPPLSGVLRGPASWPLSRCPDPGDPSGSLRSQLRGVELRVYGRARESW
jgi:hypothetical protein